MEITKDCVFKMHKLEKRKENEEEFLIGRPDVSDFVILPNLAIEIIELLDSGLTVSEIEKVMAEKEIDVDVMDFASSLVNDLLFVHMVNGVVVNEVVNDNGHFENISEHTAKRFFNRFAFGAYLLLFIVGVSFCLYDHSFIPKYQDAIVFPSVTLSLIISTAIGWVLIFTHEFAHLLAAKSLSVKSKIGLGHRLVFPVAETDMSNIVLLPHKRRYKALIAGMAWDGALFGLGVFVLFLGNYVIELDIYFLNLIKLINLICVLGIAFQFFFYLETDIYYVLTTFFKCNNLIHNTRLYVRILTKRANLEQKLEFENIDLTEKKIMKGYIWIYIIGVIWAITLFMTVTLPTFIKFVSLTLVKMFNNPFFSREFFDGIIFILLSSIPFIILGWSWYKTWKTNQSRNNRRVSSEAI
ncbi:hypothetical protein AM500_04770 [Bacillus sp. FJAT-18017]|uniref:hypothetical protein n=1 Tax=Bacillus sp. FJAT-18017 TaxID=1705566 RepID=UPI0006AD8C85|nr:hypothetical protein [Bacillus sp. FJAT-18017]ALC89178.1 hypothetical protein AM500_04770 [Bacillus sp. FJAT-18017]